MNNESMVYFKPVRTALITLLVLGAVFLAVESISVIKAWTGPADKTKVAEITVSGTADAFAVPDIATFSYIVSEEGGTVKIAQDKATTKTNAALEYLKKQGIAEKDIKTVDYNAQPKYEYQQTGCSVNYCPPGKQVLTGYTVSQTVQVKVRKTDQAGTILSGIGALNVQYVSGLQFTVDDQNAVIQSAREKAIADAKTKAAALARDLGVTLVRITSYSDNNQPERPIYFNSMKAMDSASGAAAPVPSIPAGENKYTSNVTLTYEIR